MLRFLIFLIIFLILRVIHDVCHFFEKKELRNNKGKYTPAAIKWNRRWHLVAWLMVIEVVLAFGWHLVGWPEFQLWPPRLPSGLARVCGIGLLIWLAFNPTWNALTHMPIFYFGETAWTDRQINKIINFIKTKLK